MIRFNAMIISIQLYESSWTRKWLRTPGLILGFRGFKSSSNFVDSYFLTYLALFNGLMISDIRILVLHVYCLFENV